MKLQFQSAKDKVSKPVFSTIAVDSNTMKKTYDQNIIEFKQLSEKIKEIAIAGTHNKLFREIMASDIKKITDMSKTLAETEGVTVAFHDALTYILDTLLPSNCTVASNLPNDVQQHIINAYRGLRQEYENERQEQLKKHNSVQICEKYFVI